VKTGVLMSCSIQLYYGSWLFSHSRDFIDLTILTLILAWSISLSYSCCCWVCSMFTLNPVNHWLALEISKSRSLWPVFGH